MSSIRHSKRLFPGSRQIGGSAAGLRDASLRILAGDLCINRESCSTDTSPKSMGDLTSTLIKRNLSQISKSTISTESF
jgi:hypothetical protein